MSTTDYPSQLQADRIADHIEMLINSDSDLTYLDDWTDVDKTEFGTLVIHTQDDDGTVHQFEVSVTEREVDVQELEVETDETGDPDRKRDLEQDR